LSKPTCSVAECERKHASKGFCDKHYRRWKKAGDPTVTLRTPRGACSIEGCDQAHNARGYCPAHYQAWLRANGGRVSEAEKCSVDKCLKDRTHAEFCRGHNYRFKKYGDPEYAPETPEAKVCTGCTKELSLDKFPKRKGRGGMGVMSRCRDCSRAANLARMQADREAWNSYSRKWAAENRDKRSVQEGRRRAKLRGALAESVSRLEIFERDGWICQMCFQPVDKDLKYPHPMSATWDHIVPLARGGSHTRDNLRLAHWHENQAKGAKVA